MMELKERLADNIRGFMRHHGASEELLRVSTDDEIIKAYNMAIKEAHCEELR